MNYYARRTAVSNLICSFVGSESMHQNAISEIIEILSEEIYSQYRNFDGRTKQGKERESLRLELYNIAQRINNLTKDVKP